MSQYKAMDVCMICIYKKSINVCLSTLYYVYVVEYYGCVVKIKSNKYFITTFIYQSKFL